MPCPRNTNCRTRPARPAAARPARLGGVGQRADVDAEVGAQQREGGGREARLHDRALVGELEQYGLVAELDDGAVRSARHGDRAGGTGQSPSRSRAPRWSCPIASARRRRRSGGGGASDGVKASVSPWPACSRAAAQASAMNSDVPHPTIAARCPAAGRRAAFGARDLGRAAPHLWLTPDLFEHVAHAGSHSLPSGPLTQDVCPERPNASNRSLREWSLCCTLLEQ